MARIAGKEQELPQVHGPSLGQMRPPQSDVRRTAAAGLLTS